MSLSPCSAAFLLHILGRDNVGAFHTIMEELSVQNK
jgi:hypothetical protein